MQMIKNSFELNCGWSLCAGDFFSGENVFLLSGFFSCDLLKNDDKRDMKYKRGRQKMSTAGNILNRIFRKIKKCYEPDSERWLITVRTHSGCPQNAPKTAQQTIVSEFVAWINSFWWQCFRFSISLFSLDLIFFYFAAVFRFQSLCKQKHSLVFFSLLRIYSGRF